MGEHFQSVAEVLTMFFHHDGFLDIVPSDVVAGIILVRVQQKEREQMFKFRNRLLQRKSRSSENIEDSVEGSLELMEAGSLVSYETQSIYSGSTDFTPIRPLDMSDDDDRLWLETVTRFAPYSQAMYSHLLALFLQPVTGSCGLCLTSIRKNSSFCYKQNSVSLILTFLSYFSSKYLIHLSSFLGVRLLASVSCVDVHVSNAWGKIVSGDNDWFWVITV
jgi:hypothetical protein